MANYTVCCPSCGGVLSVTYEKKKLDFQTDNYLNNSKYPRGIRNNNPGNIRLSANNWQGKITPSKDKDFEQFLTMDFGIRASFLNLKTYYQKHGLRTLRQIINRWAPSTENDVSAYLNQLQKYTGVNPDGLLKWDVKTITVLLYALFIHENGAVYINKPQIENVVKNNW